MMYTLLERIRDIEQGKNTLMTLDEVLALGGKILIFKDGVKIPHVGHISFDLSDSDAIDSEPMQFIDYRWALNSKLGREASDLKMRTEYEVASKAYFDSSRDYRDDKELLDEWHRIEKRFSESQAEFRYFRPSIITRQIMNADIIVGSMEVLKKVVSEIPSVKPALLELDSGDINWSINPQEDNYPRILVRRMHFDPYNSDNAQVDSYTIDMLLNRKVSVETDAYDWESSMRMAIDSLDNPLKGKISPEFYRHLEQNISFLSNTVSRSRLSVDLPQRIVGKGYRHMVDAETKSITVNLFGTGGKNALEEYDQKKIKRTGAE